MRSEAEIRKTIEEVKEREKYARKEVNRRFYFGNDWYVDVKQSEANQMRYLRKILEWVLDEQIKLF